MHGDITMCCAETGTQVFLLVIRTNCSVCLSFHAEPVHDYRTARGTRSGRQCVCGCSLCHFSCLLFLLTGWTTSEVFQCFLCSFPVRPFCAAPGHVCAWRDNLLSVGCVFSGIPLGVGERLSTPQVQRLHLLVPWLLRRKRDCTPALFLTSSVCTSALSPCSTEEEGLAPLPSSSHCRGVLRRRRDRPSSSYCRYVPRREKDRPSPSQQR